MNILILREAMVESVETCERLERAARPTEGPPTLGAGSNGGGPAPADLGHFYTAADRTRALSLAIHLMLSDRGMTLDDMAELAPLDHEEWLHFIAAMLAKEAKQRAARRARVVHIRFQNAPSVLCGAGYATSVGEAWGWWGPGGEGFKDICSKCYAAQQAGRTYRAARVRVHIPDTIGEIKIDKSAPCPNNPRTLCECCGGDGWLLMNESSGIAEIQRCDDCEKFPSDDEAAEAAIAAGRSAWSEEGIYLTRVT
jgi:hypothetical protein